MRLIGIGVTANGIAVNPTDPIQNAVYVINVEIEGDSGARTTHTLHLDLTGAIPPGPGPGPGPGPTPPGPKRRSLFSLKFLDVLKERITGTVRESLISFVVQLPVKIDGKVGIRKDLRRLEKYRRDINRSHWDPPYEQKLTHLYTQAVETMIELDRLEHSYFSALRGLFTRIRANYRADDIDRLIKEDHENIINPTIPPSPSAIQSRLGPRGYSLLMGLLNTSGNAGDISWNNLEIQVKDTKRLMARITAALVRSQRTVTEAEAAARAAGRSPTP